jgi:hypothetical protein
VTVKQMLIAGAVMVVAAGITAYQMPRLRTATKPACAKTKVSVRPATQSQVVSSRSWKSSLEKIFFGTT